MACAAAAACALCPSFAKEARLQHLSLVPPEEVLSDWRSVAALFASEVFRGPRWRVLGRPCANAWEVRGAELPESIGGGGTLTQLHGDRLERLVRLLWFMGCQQEPLCLRSAARELARQAMRAASKRVDLAPKPTPRTRTSSWFEQAERAGTAPSPSRDNAQLLLPRCHLPPDRHKTPTPVAPEEALETLAAFRLAAAARESNAMMDLWSSERAGADICVRLGSTFTMACPREEPAPSQWVADIRYANQRFQVDSRPPFLDIHQRL